MGRAHEVRAASMAKTAAKFKKLRAIKFLLMLLKEQLKRQKVELTKTIQKLVMKVSDLATAQLSLIA